jgi:hypothetical protein
MAAEIEMLRKEGQVQQRLGSPQPSDGFETVVVTRGTAKPNLISSIGHQSRNQGSQGYQG